MTAPRRHPDLRMRYTKSGGRSLGGPRSGEWVEVSPEVEALVALCDGETPPDELARRFSAPGVGEATKRILVEQTIAQLAQRGLLQVAGEQQPFLDDYTRWYGDASVHRVFVSDAARTDLYREAIRELVRPGDVVIDVGTGTGLLAMFAAEAGASVVHAIEPSPIADQAERILADNGFSDRVVLHRADAFGLELEVKADVIIADWIGQFVFMERIFRAVAKQRDRCLMPDGRMFPESVELRVAPLCDPAWRAAGPEFWGTRPYGFEFGSLLPLEYSTLSSTQRAVASETLLAPPETLHTFTARALDPKDLRELVTAEVEFTIERDGTLDGFCGFFRAQLSPSVSLDTGPGSPETFYQQQHFATPPLAVRAGDRLSLAFTVDKVGYRFHGALRGAAGESPFSYAYPYE
jgi:SAM-dependent methyltransferase